MIGQIIAHYRIIGEDRFTVVWGVVYRGRLSSATSGRESSSCQTMLIVWRSAEGGFEREARSACALNHPHILYKFMMSVNGKGTSLHRDGAA
jgi:hypothetical protein